MAGGTITPVAVAASVKVPLMLVNNSITGYSAKAGVRGFKHVGRWAQSIGNERRFRAEAAKTGKPVQEIRQAHYESTGQDKTFARLLSEYQQDPNGFSKTLLTKADSNPLGPEALAVTVLYDVFEADKGNFLKAADAAERINKMFERR